MDIEIMLTEIRHALRRSKVRVALLLALLRLHEAYAADLARAAGVELKRVRPAMHGDGREYKQRDGLVVLGLVRATRGRGRTTYSLTTRGRAIARHLQRETMKKMTTKPVART